MRERPVLSQFNHISDRITPAYAGKTIEYFSLSMIDWDHPRVCGKDCIDLEKEEYGQGSPPRMRERLAEAYNSRPSLGITPAYAGKTIGNIPQSKVVKDHPRVCGKDLNLY